MNAIAAVDANWAIGNKNRLLTSIPADMKFFRETTKNSVVIYGRKTLESFPASQPLKNRINIIITRNADFKCEGAFVVHSVEEAVEESKKYADKNVFVIGGGTIYRQMLKYCDKAYITKIDRVFENADTFIDNLDELKEWHIVDESEEKEYNGTKFKFVTYIKK